MNEKSKLSDNLEYLSEQQCKLLNEVINAFCNPHLGKGKLLELSTDNTNSIDTAIPLDYQRSIEEILPSFKSFYHVYDYRTNKFGEMSNVAEMFVNRLNTVLSEQN